jgi:hypothetical protein
VCALAHCTPSPQFCSAFSMLHLTLLSGFVSSSASMALSARSAPRFSSSSPEGSERVSISYQVCLPVQISWLVITVRVASFNPTCILTFNFNTVSSHRWNVQWRFLLWKQAEVSRRRIIGCLKKREEHPR